MRIDLRHGDCLARMAEIEGSVTRVFCDPPYGIEFMQNDGWDNLWESSARMDNTRYNGNVGRPLPIFGMSRPFGDANPTCHTCRGKLRGKHKCQCEDPDWYIKGKPVKPGQMRIEHAQRMQAWHEKWLRVAYRLLESEGLVLAFGGTRTYHRLAAAMVAAGFVLDTESCLQAWVYGSGFPKSMKVESVLLKRGVNPVDAARFRGSGTAIKPAWEAVLVGRKPTRLTAG